MKAISIRQPWAHAILHLGKRTENRSRAWHYVGPFLIHASLNPPARRRLFHSDVEALSKILDEAEWVRFRDEHLDLTTYGGEPLWLARSSLRCGGIVGRARIVGCKPIDEVAHAGDRWAFGPYCVEFADVEPLQFTPIAGAMGLWNVPDSISHLVEVEP